MSRSFLRLLVVVPALGLSACAVPPGSVAPIPVGPESVAPLPVQAGGPSVGERLAADEERIRDGARMGQFTPREYNELQGRHAAIERTRREQLAAYGGRIPPGLYAQLEEREAALSRTIFDYRHNGATPTAH